ncbi:MAG: hypothetical protein ACP5O7_13410, partial [Phycisphaerae bacterium]
RGTFVTLSGGSSATVCHLYYLAAMNLHNFSLRAVRYDPSAYDGIVQTAQLYLQSHRGEPDAAKAIKLLPPLEPLPKGIVVHQFSPSGKQ